MSHIHKVINLGIQSELSNCLYSHRVELNISLQKMEEILDWVSEVKLPCTIVKEYVYLRKEELVPFLLRWA